MIEGNIMNKNLYKYTVLYRKFWRKRIKTGIILASNMTDARISIAARYNFSPCFVVIEDFEYVEVGD